MDIVKDAKIEWLKFKWIFIATSLLLTAAGVASLLGRGLNLGIDFTGGTLVYVKFQEVPDIERVRSVLSDAEVECRRGDTLRRSCQESVADPTFPRWERSGKRSE